MSESPRILIVEDSATDADLASREIRKGLGACVFKVVETREAFLGALDTFRPDLVVSDYTLPHFDGLQALQLSLQHDPLLPVILVTGSLNEETAVRCIKSGATDYVLKDRITRLPFAVKEALAQKQTRLAKEVAEQALRESERFAHATVDALSAHLAILDDNGEIIAVNRAWREFAATNSSTPVAVCEGVNYLTICDTAHGPNFTEAADMAAGIRAVMRGERPEFVLEYPCHAPAEQRWFVARVTRFAGEGAVRVVVAHENITERKQAEEALRKSQEQFRIAQDMSPDGFTILRPVRDAQEQVVDFTWIYENAAVARLNGTDPEAVVGQRLLDLFPGHRGTPFLRAYQQVAESGESCIFEANYSGESMTQPTSFRIVVVPMGNDIAILAQNITERVQAEAERQKFVMLADSSSEFIGMCDLDMKPLYVNPAGVRVVGLPDLAAACQVRVQDYFFPEDQRFIVEEFFPRVLRQGHGEVEIRLRHFQTGEPIWMFYYLFTVRDASGEIVGWATVSRDITERKRAEEALLISHRQLEILNHIGQALAQSLDVEVICRVAYEYLAGLIDCSNFGVSLYDPDTRTLKAEFILSEGAPLDTSALPRLKIDDQAPVRGRAQAILTGQVASLPDLLSANDNGPTILLGDDRLPRSALYVPMVLQGRVTGLLEMQSYRRDAYDLVDLDLLRSVSNQLSLSIENARLYQATQQELTRRQQAEEALRTKVVALQLLSDIGQAVTSSLDLDRVLLTLLEKVRDATLADACSVALMDPATNDLVFRQAVGGVAEAVIGLRLPPGQGLAGWAAQHRQSVLVPDVATDARAYRLRDRADFVTRDLIAVPLIVRDAVTGVIELVNKRRGRFDADDRRLLESVAAQASIAIEKARLFETEHAAREALETLYRIGQAVNSTLDADAILDRLTDEAMRATHATHGSALVARPDRGCFERRSLRGYSPEQTEQARADWLSLDRGVNGRAYRSQQVVYVEDAQLDPDYHPLIPGTHSELVVPILRGGQVIGNLDLQSPQVDAFRAVRLDFLQALTDQVAIALENARLFDETLRHVNEMSIVSQVALVGAAGRPFDETVARATDALSRLWPTASLGFLFVDEGNQALYCHPARYDPLSIIHTPRRVPIDQGLAGWAVREQQPIRVGDVTVDPRYFPTTSDIRSEMAAPLVIGQRVIGVIDVESPRLDAFSGDDLLVLTTLAGQLATIFEKARLDAELASYAAQLERRVEERTVEIRRAQARAQAILDALGEGVVVTDLQGTIEYMNPAMEQVTGYSARKCIGQNPRLWQSGQTPPEVYQAMWAAILAGQTWRGEIVNRRKDGELYFASLAAAPIPAADDSQGPLAGLVGIQRDISERVQAETALRESEALYHSLVEVMPQNLCRKDLAGRFIFANHQFLADLNWSLADLIGKTDFDIHPPAMAEKYRRDDQQVISTGQCFEVIEERIVPGGKSRYVQTIKAPILNSAGNVIGVQITFWDVSDHIQAEEEMRRALEKEKELNQLKSNFVSLTSHEFRTPLTAILSSAELVEHYGDRWTPEKKLEHLRRIQTAVKHMTTLLNDILIIGKAEAGKLEFRPTPLDLVKFCRDLVEEIQLTDKANHTLMFEGEVTCTQASMDQQLLRHILSNLLSNALKYSPQDSTVQFNLQCQAGQVVFQIQDHGLGIPPEDQARLFETFHRAGNVRNIQGTGLGLAIVKRSVELHGGMIDVTTQVGVGTTFTVTLPLDSPSVT